VYGVDNQNSIQFDAVPKAVMVFCNKKNYGYSFIWTPGQQSPSVTASYYVYTTFSDNKLSWYSGSNTTAQLNESGWFYTWVAIF
jgi:hypothetical protein